MANDNHISVDQFMADHKSSTFGGVVYKSIKGPKTFDPEARQARFVMSTSEEDRDFDIIKTSGIEMPDHLPAFYNHSPNQQIGSWEDVSKGTKYMEGTLKWAEEGTNQWTDQSFSLVRQGHLKGASIGFIPKKLKGRENEKGERIRGYIIESAEVVECSVVAVPSNRGSGIKGLAAQGVPQEVVEYILDELVKTPAGLIIPRADYEAMHKEATGQRTGVIISRVPQLKATITIDAESGEVVKVEADEQQRNPDPPPLMPGDTGITAAEKGVLQRLYDKFFGDPEADERERQAQQARVEAEKKAIQQEQEILSAEINQVEDRIKRALAA
jgi:HK97 family phage prohead protease